MKRLLIILIFTLFTSALFAAIEVRKFSSIKNKRLYHELTNMLRCQVCDNQAISDSNAQVARSLRNVVFNLVLKGKNEEEILSYLVKRYGEQISYRPTVKAGTFILWFGPAIIFLFVIFLFVKKVSAASDDSTTELSETELNALRKIKSDDPKN